MTNAGIIHIETYNRYKVKFFRFSFLFLQVSFHTQLEWRGIFILLIEYPTTKEFDSKLRERFPTSVDLCLYPEVTL